MTNKEFINVMNRLQNNFSKKLDSETYKLYWNEFKDFSYERFNNVINKIIQTNKFFPTISEINSKIIEDEKVGNLNLNSSYWYANLREFCDRDGTPYYDITKGPDFPLPPYKDWEKNK